MAADAGEHGTEQWDEYSYVVSSQYRVTTLERLAQGPATPSQIASGGDQKMTHVSRALKELRDRGMVDLLVSEDRKKGRVYGLTDDGRAVREMVEEHHSEAA